MFSSLLHVLLYGFVSKAHRTEHNKQDSSPQGPQFKYDASLESLKFDMSPSFYSATQVADVK